MSIKGIVDTVVHVHSFRNIDLLEQGVYMLHLTVRSASDSLDSPYLLDQCSTKKSPNRKHCVIESVIDDVNFFTKGFLIRYVEEEANLNDLAVFRSEIEPNTGCPVVITLGLMFAELKAAATNDEVAVNPPSFSDFTLLSTQRVQINRPLEGVHQFVSVIFTEAVPCQVNITIHVALMDFRYRFDHKGSHESECDLAKLAANVLFGSKEIVENEDVEQVADLWVGPLQKALKKVHSFTNKFSKTAENNRKPLKLREISRRKLDFQKVPIKLTKQFLVEMQEISTQLHITQQALLFIIREKSLELTLYLQREYITQLKEQ